MHRPRGGASHMPSAAPGQGKPSNDRTFQRRRRGPRFHRGKGSKRHHHYRPHPHTRKPENSYSNKASAIKDTLRISLEPQTFDSLQYTRAHLLNMLYVYDARVIGHFRELLDVEADIEYYQNVQHHQENQYQRHDQYPAKNSNVKVKVDGIPANEINDRIRREEAEQGQGKLQAAYRQRLWLHDIIADNVLAELNINMYLSELHVEARCRERWDQVKRERSARLASGSGFGPGYIPYQKSYFDPRYGTMVPPYAPGGFYPSRRYDEASPRSRQGLILAYADPGSPFPDYDEDWGYGMQQPASYQAGKGQGDHMGEADKEWIDSEMGNRKVPENPSNMRRWSFPCVNHEASHVETMSL